MTLGVRSRVRLAFAAVLLLGAGLSLYVYLNGRSVLKVSEPLLRQQLAQLEAISRLRLTLAAQEPVLYEYYATQDRAAFQNRFAANERAIHSDLDALSMGAGDAVHLARIREEHAAMQGLAGKLDETLRVYGSEPVDWDRARELLVEVSRVVGQINAELDYLAAASHAEVTAAGQNTRDRIHGVVQVVAAFSVLLGVIAAFVGHFVSSYLRESAEREKLAMFAEKNPNPVLRLSAQAVQDAMAQPLYEATRDQLHALRAMGCDEMQGYRFCKPLPLDEFSAFLSSGRRLETGAGRSTDRRACRASSERARLRVRQ